MIASAETGTGKTAAFLLPILQKLIEEKPKGTAVLVLAPTRELANQTEAACREFAPKDITLRGSHRRRGLSQSGGRSAARRNIIIATPGRLMDFMDRAKLIFRSSRRSFSTKPTACSIWAFCPRSSGSSKLSGRTADAVLLGDDVARDRKDRLFDDERTRICRSQPTRKSCRI